MKLPKNSLALAAIAALLALAPASHAQPTNGNHTPPGTNAPGGGGRRMRNAEEQLNQLSEQLKLTEEQKPQVKAALEEQNKKLTELRGDSGVAQEDRRTKMQTIREETTKKLKEILTPEQFKKYGEIQQQQRNRRPTGAPGAPATGGPGAEGGNTKPADGK